MFRRPSRKELQQRIEVLERKLESIADPNNQWEREMSMQPLMEDLVQDFRWRNEFVYSQPRMWRPNAAK